MIPAQNIVAWSKTAPWSEPRQVEQVLIISRALVELFSDPFLRGELRFRGGTALNKLHFPKPQRYSEDIDLVRTTGGPIGPVLDQIRRFSSHGSAGRASTKAMWPQSSASAFSLKAKERRSGSRSRSTRVSAKPTTRLSRRPSGSRNPWFAGEAGIPTFSIEEMLATKLRALLQRNKGRDLVDLSHSLEVFPDLSTVRVVELLRRYLALSEQAISRAQAEERMLANSSGLISCRMSGRCSRQTRQVASTIRQRELRSSRSSLASYGCCPATHGRTRLP